MKARIIAFVAVVALVGGCFGYAATKNHKTNTVSAACCGDPH